MVCLTKASRERIADAQRRLVALGCDKKMAVPEPHPEGWDCSCELWHAARIIIDHFLDG